MLDFVINSQFSFLFFSSFLDFWRTGYDVSVLAYVDGAWGIPDVYDGYENEYDI